ncbi:MAG TPA: DMT family transporter, partial [Pseudobdellovibrionaceae bacterium]|nr:DMT family transporter [Pseudobdellovibrionaceae bacterium]
MKHYLLFILALFCLAQSPNIIKFSQIPINAFGFWRLLIAACILYGIHYFRTSKPIFSFNKNSFPFKFKKNHLLIILSGIVFFTHLWTFFFAAKNTQIANAMIIYSVNPLFTALGSFLFFQEKFTWKLFFSYLLAFSGILIIFSSGFELHSDRFLGDASALLSAFLFAVYALISKHVRKNVDNLVFAATVYLITSLCFGLNGLSQQQNFWGYSTTDLITLAASILIPTLLGHALFTYLLNH